MIAKTRLLYIDADRRHVFVEPLFKNHWVARLLRVSVCWWGTPSIIFGPAHLILGWLPWNPGRNYANLFAVQAYWEWSDHRRFVSIGFGCEPGLWLHVGLAVQ